MNRDLKPRRYIGLEVSGAKNNKTALAAIEYYPKENKIFLLDIYDKISGQGDKSGDEVLLEIIEEEKPTLAKLAINVPLSLPPCITCSKKGCPMPHKCPVNAIKWMREQSKKHAKFGKKSQKNQEFTPYTQRPIELFIKFSVLPNLQQLNRFEIDEALGGNKAPLTARMHFLKRHLKDVNLAEVWPKLSTLLICNDLGISKKIMTDYRDLEDGISARGEILDVLAKERGIFIYERDLQKLSRSLAAFDALVCAYTALLSDINGCAVAPTNFPGSWIEYPCLPTR